MHSPSILAPRRSQRGAAAVEFAITSLVAIPLLIAGLEIGRLMYAMNAASGATDAGARVASACGIGNAAILNNMRTYLPGLTNGDVSVAQACPASGFCTITVRILPSYQMNTMIPYMNATFGVPPVTATTVRAERRNPADNAICN